MIEIKTGVKQIVIEKENKDKDNGKTQIIETFPSNKSESVPVGVKIEITFDRAVDVQSAKDNIVIYGRDFDLVSGPETATWMHEGDALNPVFESLNLRNYRLYARCSHV